MCADPNTWQPCITHENISAPEYRTAEDFYKLTGVGFPELEMVDSLFYDEGFIRSCTWHEYKFAAKDGLDEDSETDGTNGTKKAHSRNCVLVRSSF